jgi:hypothetical protein
MMRWRGLTGWLLIAACAAGCAATGEADWDPADNRRARELLGDAGRPYVLRTEWPMTGLESFYTAPRPAGVRGLCHVRNLTHNPHGASPTFEIEETFAPLTPDIEGCDELDPERDFFTAEGDRRRLAFEAARALQAAIAGAKAPGEPAFVLTCEEFRRGCEDGRKALAGLSLSWIVSVETGRCPLPGVARPASCYVVELSDGKTLLSGQDWTVSLVLRDGALRQVTITDGGLWIS